jgi:hypothetical protein
MWGPVLRPLHSTATGLGLRTQVTRAYPQALYLALYLLPRHTGTHIGVRTILKSAGPCLLNYASQTPQAFTVRLDGLLQHLWPDHGMV